MAAILDFCILNALKKSFILRYVNGIIYIKNVFINFLSQLASENFAAIIEKQTPITLWLIIIDRLDMVTTT